MLLGGCLLSLGSFISSLTENQLIAAVLTFAAFLMVWVIDLGRNAGGGAGSVLEYLSVIRHYRRFHARSDRYVQSDLLREFHGFLCFLDGARSRFHALAPGVRKIVITSPGSGGDS